MADETKKLVIELELELAKARRQLQQFQQETQKAVSAINKANLQADKETERRKGLQQKREYQEYVRTNQEKRRDEARHLREGARKKSIQQDRDYREYLRVNAEKRRREREQSQYVQRYQREQRQQDQRASASHFREQARIAKQQEQQAGARGMRQASRGAMFDRGAARVGSFGRGAAYMAGGSLLGLLIGGAMQGYAALQSFRQNSTGALGSGTGPQVRSAILANRGARQRLGFSLQDSARLSPVMARATGMLMPDELMQATRAHRMDSGEVAQHFGTIRQGGTSFANFVPGKKGQQSDGGKAFEKIMAGAVKSGLEHGRLPEFAKAVTSLMQEQMRITARMVDPARATQTMAWMGAAGARHGMPGFQGSSGALTEQSLRQGVQSPGGGPAGESIVLQALGMGSRGYYKARKRMENPGAAEYTDIIKFMQRTGGAGEGAAELMANVLRIPRQLAEDIQSLVARGNASPEEITGLINKHKETLGQGAQKGMVRGDTRFDHQRQAKVENRNIGHGAKVADAVEWLQDQSAKIFNAMVDGARKAGDIITAAFAAVKDLFGFGKPTPRAQAAGAAGAVTGPTAGGKTPEQAFMDVRDDMKRAAAAHDELAKKNAAARAAQAAAPWYAKDVGGAVSSGSEAAQQAAAGAVIHGAAKADALGALATMQGKKPRAITTAEGGAVDAAVAAAIERGAPHMAGQILQAMMGSPQWKMLAELINRAAGSGGVHIHIAVPGGVYGAPGKE